MVKTAAQLKAENARLRKQLRQARVLLRLTLTPRPFRPENMDVTGTGLKLVPTDLTDHPAYGM